MADIAKMVARLELQASQFQTGMEKAQKQVDRFRRETTTSLNKIQTQFSEFGRNVLKSFAVGSITAAVYGLTRAVGSAIQAGDDLAKFAQKSGLAAEAASELAHAARMADIDLQTLGNGIRFMQTNLSKIGSSDGKEAEAVLTAIGLSLRDLQNMKPEDQFMAIGDAIKRLPNIEDQTRAWQFFGKAGLELAPAFEEGAAGIRAAMDEAQRLGKSFSAEDLAKFQAADDAFKRLGAAGDGLASILAIKLEPAITAVVSAITRLLTLDFDKSDFFAFLTAPPSQKLVLMAKMLKGAGDDAAKLASSGPTGRSLPGLTSGAGPGFKPDAPNAPKLSQSQMDEMEKFRNQANQIKQDLAAAFNSIAPALTENDAAISSYFTNIREQTIGTTARVIEMGEAFQNTQTDIEIFAEQAARNIQDAFADFFMNMDKGFKGMAQGFIDAIRSMVANLIASQLLNFIGGALAGSSNPFFASMGAAMSAQPRAMGGPVSGGRPYVVGEKGPELFVPGASGSIVPNGSMGGVTYAPTINAQGADASLRAALPGILQESHRQFLKSLRDHRSRGVGL